MTKKEKPKIDKEDFIGLLASMTPQEINQYILTKGKPPKPVWPVYISRKSKYAYCVYGDT